MQHFRGSIQRDGDTVADGVEGNLTIDTLANGNEAWSGFFTLPLGQIVQFRDTFDLVLEDGRSKKIEIVRVNAGPDRPAVASFETVL